MTGGPLVAVCGSVNTDLVGYTQRLPRAGETVLGTELHTMPGGKGANQAVAARRYGVAVRLIGAVGADSFGQAAVAGFVAEDIDVSELAVVELAPTGVALICVDATGENQIVVLPGANLHVPIPRPCGAAAWLCQGEVPALVIEGTLAAAREDDGLAIINASPVENLDRRVLRDFDLAVVNEIEYAQLRADLPERVVVTRGAAGARILPGGKDIATPRVKALDTTGAGDAFAGVLAAALAEGLDLERSAEVAAAAAALSVEKPGCQPSYPIRAAIESRLSSP